MLRKSQHWGHISTQYKIKSKITTYFQDQSFKNRNCVLCMFCLFLTAQKINRKFGDEIQKLYVFIVVLLWQMFRAIIAEIARQRWNLE